MFALVLIFSFCYKRTVPICASSTLGYKDIFKCTNVIWEFGQHSMLFIWASIDFHFRGGHPEGLCHLPLLFCLLLFISFLFIPWIIEASRRATQQGWGGLPGWINHMGHIHSDQVEYSGACGPCEMGYRIQAGILEGGGWLRRPRVSRLPRTSF